VSIGHQSVIEHCHGNGKFLNDIEMEKYLSKGKNFNQIFWEVLVLSYMGF